MPRLLVNLSASRYQVFELREGETLVGREADATLQLSNVSVSRQHAKFHVEGRSATLWDLGSGNGTRVNGQPVTTADLRPRDEIKIGKFTLIYLSDDRSDEFYKGRCVRYMPPYEPAKAVEVRHAETHLLSRDALKAMAMQEQYVEQGRIVWAKDPSKFWHPEDRTLTFGGAEAMIHPGGWFIWGTVAEVAWDGKRHRLKKLAFWVPVSVNDRPVTDAVLDNGDRVRVGTSLFRYQA